MKGTTVLPGGWFCFLLCHPPHLFTPLLPCTAEKIFMPEAHSYGYYSKAMQFLSGPLKKTVRVVLSCLGLVPVRPLAKQSVDTNRHGIAATHNYIPQ